MVENLNMNDKIKEFANQANLQPYYDAQEQHIEEFAQLVAKSCFRAAMQATRGHNNPAIMIEEFEKQLGFKVHLTKST